MKITEDVIKKRICSLLKLIKMKAEGKTTIVQLDLNVAIKMYGLGRSIIDLLYEHEIIKGEDDHYEWICGDDTEDIASDLVGDYIYYEHPELIKRKKVKKEKEPQTISEIMASKIKPKRKDKNWTDEELRFILDSWGDEADKVAKQLQRTRVSIYSVRTEIRYGRYEHRGIFAPDKRYKTKVVSTPTLKRSGSNKRKTKKKSSAKLNGSSNHKTKTSFSLLWGLIKFEKA